MTACGSEAPESNSSKSQYKGGSHPCLEAKPCTTAGDQDPLFWENLVEGKYYHRRPESFCGTFEGRRVVEKHADLLVVRRQADGHYSFYRYGSTCNDTVSNLDFDSQQMTFNSTRTELTYQGKIYQYEGKNWE